MSSSGLMVAILDLPLTVWSCSVLQVTCSKFLHIYTTPLSTFVSNSAANPHLYAENTHLLLSFSALDFSHDITPTGYLQIFCLLILLKMSFSSLVYHNNSINSVILKFIYPTMSYSLLLILLLILVSFLIKIYHLSNISLLFLNHASSIFVT